MRMRPSGGLPAPTLMYNSFAHGVIGTTFEDAVRHRRVCMAEHAADLPQATEVPDRGGSFLFEPVGARTFVAPERFS